MNSLLNKWTEQASDYIGSHYDNCKPLLDKDLPEANPLVRFVSTQLYLSCHSSSKSSLILLKAGQAWDAEIINRSVMEGVVKYIFMLHGSNEERLTKTKEYWEILPKYSLIKRSEQAHELLKEMKAYNLPNWNVIQDTALNEAEIANCRGNSNYKERSELIQKWSFSKIAENLAKIDKEQFGFLVHLGFSYGLDSNLIHKDATGVGMISERSNRNNERKKLAHLAHIARLVSDMCIFTDILSLTLFRSCNQNFEFIGNLRVSYSSLFSELRQANENFNKKEYSS